MPGHARRPSPTNVNLDQSGTVLYNNNSVTPMNPDEFERARMHPGAYLPQAFAQVVEEPTGICGRFLFGGTEMQ